MEKDFRDGLTILEQAKLVRTRAEEIIMKENMTIGEAFIVATKELFN